MLRARALAFPKDAVTLAWLERVITHIRDDQSLSAPPEVVARAARLLRPLAPPRAPSLRERVSAALRFDSRLQPAFGVRSGFASTRQLLFNAGMHDIDLRIAPSGGSWTISGQVLGPEGPGSVALELAGTRWEAKLNDLAEFELPPIAAGTYTLSLELEDAEIVIDRLHIEG
ncbi:hypothetical protein F8S13_24990 [Chloroflexia bacterium SDU3-3]|nr:hypothetical protein F8S13_24990 [Chloroflexia bacterium SDU3-3]